MSPHTGRLNPETDRMALHPHSDSKLLVRARAKCQGLPFLSHSVQL